MYRASTKSKSPGAIYVCPPGRDAGWYGRIELDGTYTPNSNLVPQFDLLAQLHAFAASPESYAANYGLATKVCCFCAIALSDPRSLLVGYGPICAGNYGLPWGDK